MVMRVDNSENSRGVGEGLSEASVLLRGQSQVVCGETITELQEAGLSRYRVNES